MSGNFSFLKKILLFLLVLFVFSFIRPSIIHAQTPVISDTGRLNFGESKTITVSGLDPNTQYLWLETKGYTEIYNECVTSNATGEITKTLGPFFAPEPILLKIGDCRFPADKGLIEHTFTMNGQFARIGPINLSPAGFTSADIYFQIKVKTTNPDKEYIFKSNENPCPASSNPCISEGYLLTNTTGVTYVEISDKKFFKNGVETKGIFTQTEPAITSWDLRENSTTGPITYRWNPVADIPGIIIYPKEITPAESAFVSILLPDQKADEYTVQLTSTIGVPINRDDLLSILCNKSFGCSLSTIKNTTFFQNIKISNNKLLTFDISGSKLKNGASYRVTINVLQNNPIAFLGSNYDTFIVKDSSYNLNVVINPSTMQEEDTKNASIKVTLVNGTSEPYTIGSKVFNCSGANCQIDFSLDKAGFSPGEYLITVVNRNNPAIKGAAKLTVEGKKTTGGPGAGTGADAAPSPSPCTGEGCTVASGKPCGTDKDPAIATAIGCIHTNPVNFTGDLLKFLTAIGGGFAFLLMLLGAFQMISSAGNPETLQAGRDRFTSALIGLLLVIFAVLLMKIIGVDILCIPGFDARCGI